MYVTVDFISIGIVELYGTRKKQELQNENFLSTVGFDPGIFRLLDSKVIHCAMKPLEVLSFKGKLYTHILQCIKTRHYCVKGTITGAPLLPFCVVKIM